MGIEPVAGSTFLDAEHVVILMQENRSFDHAFGTLRGVRGFEDPRAIALPDGNPVWLQTDTRGNTFAPFPLKIHETSSTWMSCLPHDRESQVAAGNRGKHDRWLLEKQSGIRDYEEMPLTLGYYDRTDLPFYHAFADAFTICDQHFCSVQTSTTPNRLFLWTGTSRDPRDPTAKVLLTNGESDHNSKIDWRTFPERLQDHSIEWKIYQNEVDFQSGLGAESASWLGNFGDNPLEYFSQYNIRFSPGNLSFLERQLAALEAKLDEPPAEGIAPETVATEREELQQKIERVAAELTENSAESFAKLTAAERDLHQRAFTVNSGDPFYRDLTAAEYLDGDELRSMNVPKGDVLHQFRSDVAVGKLPTVSWLVAPENFSDHPSAPWYGAWYVSEVLEILTRNPEVWKKTILISTYDENDGYFDHVPPFVAPNPADPTSGAASPGLAPELEHDELGHPVGLGYRVPMIIASPWSRGGHVCSQIFDHTSVLQFLEVLLSHRTGREIRETNIGAWRRAVCGDLTSAFRPHLGGPGSEPPALERNHFVNSIHRTRYLNPPADFRSLNDQEIQKIRSNPHDSLLLPRQEPGTRPSCALPYALHADAEQSENSIAILFRSDPPEFSSKPYGAPFQVYSLVRTHPDNAANHPDGSPVLDEMRRWSFAVGPGKSLSFSWPLDLFENKCYHLRTYGPNGFFREYIGNGSDPLIKIASAYRGDHLILHLASSSDQPLRGSVRDVSYETGFREFDLAPGESSELVINLAPSGRWYDLEIAIAGAVGFSRRFAGRVENGQVGISDPLIGKRRDDGAHRD